MGNMRFKVGDRVLIKSLDWYNENKDKYGFVDFSTSVFVPGMSQFCGKIVTIEDVFEEEDGVVYCMEGIDYDWTDEMIEGLVEEECPQDFIEKYCTSCGTQRCDRTKEYLNGCPYYNAYRCKNQNNVMEEKTKPEPKFKVGDKIKLKSTLLNDIFGVIGYEPEGYRITNISNGLTYFMSYSIEHDYELVEEEVFIKANDIYNEEYSKGEYCHEQSFKWGFQEGYNYSHENDKLEISLKEGYQFVDENGNVINATKIVLEKKENEYPNSYSKCCDILGCPFLYSMNTHRHAKELQSLYMLLICRDAYWKLYGEEKGLGKPWEPDWNDEEQDKYGFHNEVKYTIINSAMFVFPTSEMRDAFKENFDPDIEICKEFL